jgi:hypothetical protein
MSRLGFTLYAFFQVIVAFCAGFITCSVLKVGTNVPKVGIKKWKKK